STKISCAAPSMATARTGVRVVCTLCDTIATLVPTSALMRVDLPTLGAPMSATKPQRRPAGAAGSGSAIAVFRLDALVGEHGRGCGLLGGAFRAAETFGRETVGKLDDHAELRVVVGSFALDLPIGGGGQT